MSNAEATPSINGELSCIMELVTLNVELAPSSLNKKKMSFSLQWRFKWYDDDGLIWYNGDLSDIMTSIATTHNHVWYRSIECKIFNIIMTEFVSIDA
jgi:uncharacterized protein YcfL